MMRGIKLVVAIAAAIVLVPSVLSAWNLLNPARRWYAPPTFTVDNRGLPSISDIDGGATSVVNDVRGSQAWNGSNCGQVVWTAKGSVSGFALGDGRPMINFRDPWGACTGTCLALTYLGYFIPNDFGNFATVTDADVVTNAFGFQWTSRKEDPSSSTCSNEYYVEAVMVHEVGHALGLAHSTVSPSVTMYPTVQACDQLHYNIETDDRNGLRATAPPPVVNSSCQSTCDVQLDSCIGTGSQDPNEIEHCWWNWELCSLGCMCN